VLELDFRAVKFLFFPRRDLNPHHIYICSKVRINNPIRNLIHFKLYMIQSFFFKVYKDVLYTTPLMLRVKIQFMARCTTLCDKVCQWQVSRWFSPGTPFSFTNKTDRHDITEILLKVALNIIKPNQIKPLCLVKAVSEIKHDGNLTRKIN
jgi:hypothetical protein